MLPYAVISINLAFIFYTIGVWTERKQGILKFSHVVIFCLGLLFDTLGTIFMSKVSRTALSASFHGITGLSALLLMLFHVLWSIWVHFGSQQQMKNDFHRFSITVWVIWLIPFFSGAVIGMAR